MKNIAKNIMSFPRKRESRPNLSAIMKGWAFLFSFLICFVFISTSAYAAIYYIDYASGSDSSNSGTSESAPWKLAPGMTGFSGTYTHQGGDHFVFKGGVTWPSTVLPLTIKYSGAGVGNEDTYTVDKTWYSGSSWNYPVFDGGMASIGEAIYGSHESNIIIDSFQVQNVGNPPSTVWQANHSYGAKSYVRPTSVNDNGFYYLTAAACTSGSSEPSPWGTVNLGATTDGSCSWSRQLSSGSGNAIFFDGGSNIEVKNNLLQPGALQAFAYGVDGNNESNIKFHDNQIAQAGRVMIYGEIGYVLNGVQMYNNTYAGSGSLFLGDYHQDGFMLGIPGHPANPPVAIENVSFYNNYFYGDWSAGATAQFYSLGGLDGVSMYNNVFAYENTSAPGVDTVLSPAFVFFQNDANINVYNNTFSGDALYGYDSVLNLVLGVVNGLEIATPITGTSINIEGNIFSNMQIGLNLDTSTSAAYNVDYNLYNPATGKFGDLLFYGPHQYKTLAATQSIGFDAHSAVTNPGFIAIPNGTVGSGNWHLQTGSQAINNSVNLSSIFTADIRGKARPASGAWDIGAYQWGNIYYIDFESGSDSNNGTSENTPWQHAPGMNGFSASYTHQPGDNFIFKGGVTWPNSVFTWVIPYSGTSSEQDYYGVDKTWFAGSSWTRPIFNSQGQIAGTNDIEVNLLANGASYVTFDNLEFTGHYWTGTNAYGTNVTFLASYDNFGVLIKNCYFHGWTHSPLEYIFTVSGITTWPSVGSMYTQPGTWASLYGTYTTTFTVVSDTGTGTSGTITATPSAVGYAGEPSVNEDTPLSGALTKSTGTGDSTITFSTWVQTPADTYMVVMGYPWGAPAASQILTNNTISGSDGDGMSGAAIASGWGTVSNNTINYMSNGIDGGFCVINNNTISYINVSYDPTMHENSIQTDLGQNCQTNTQYIYNNIIHDTSSSTDMDFSGFTSTTNPASIYFYNNLMWNIQRSNPVDVDPEDSVPGNISAYVWNNTIVSPSGICFHVTNRGAGNIGLLSLQNNNCISDNATTYENSSIFDAGMSANTIVNNSNLLLSSATAAADGYAISNQFQPTSLSSPTVGAQNSGANLTSQGITSIDLDILGNSRPSPSSDVWDIGAYQYTAAPSITLQPVSVTAIAPATATFSASATGTPAPSYQWYSCSLYCAIAGQWRPVNGATNASYTTAATSVSNSGTEYEVVATNGASPAATSSAATLMVTGPSVGSLTVLPSMSTVGQALALSAGVTDTSNGATLSVQFTATPIGGSTTSYPSISTSSPYTYSWTPNTAGTYAVNVTATDSNGATATCAPVSIMVSSSGDASGDGYVTIYDAEVTAQKAIGLSVTPFYAANAEVDGTGTMDIYDAYLIAEYVASNIIQFAAHQ